MSKKLYYALKRQSTNGYISPVGYSSFREQKEPHTFRRLATARQHRLRAFAFMAAKDGVITDDITIEKVWINIELAGIEEESIAVTAKIAKFCKAIHERETFARINVNFFNDIEIVQFAEDLMRSSPKAASLRYVVRFDADAKIGDVSDTVKLVRKGNVALIATHEDLAIFKLHQPSVDFVYDTETGVFLD